VLLWSLNTRPAGGRQRECRQFWHLQQAHFAGCQPAIFAMRS
jgi:hypothetical protein